MAVTNIPQHFTRSVDYQRNFNFVVRITEWPAIIATVLTGFQPIDSEFYVKSATLRGNKTEVKLIKHGGTSTPLPMVNSNEKTFPFVLRVSLVHPLYNALRTWSELVSSEIDGAMYPKLLTCGTAEIGLLDTTQRTVLEAHRCRNFILTEFGDIELDKEGNDIATVQCQGAYDYRDRLFNFGFKPENVIPETITGVLG